MKKINWTDLLISVVSAELVGAVSALFSGSFTSFYSQLAQPPLSPPAAVFPIVWAILYALMGISAYLIWKSCNSGQERSTAIGLYIIQLALNFSWSIIFFRFRKLGLAVIAALLLFAAVFAMIMSFRKVRPLAAWLNVPYLLWLAFAVYLSAGTWVLNR